MREILFRGKLANRSGWVEGFFVLLQLVNYDRREPLITDKDTGKSYEVDPATVGQYTGLNDKNGKRIFEGDIIECWSEGVKARGTVQQNMGGLWIIYPAWQKHIMWGLCPNEDGSTDVEIIGNVHDNQELIGGGEDG